MTKKLLELNERTKQAESIKDRFLSLIKNEFNNPISSLLNIAEILANKKNQDRFDAIVTMLNSELLNLDFQLKNIFSAIEIEEGLIASHYARINFRSIFDEVVTIFRYIVSDKKLSVVLTTCDDTDFISDSNKVFIMLLNLISNACEYAFVESKIAVRLTRRESDYAISVENAGEAIKAQYANQVFSRFTKLEQSKTRTSFGLGLGLSIVRGFAESMEGSVGFTSVEGDTIFTISLPFVQSEEATGSGVGGNEFFFDDADGKTMEL
ncbi:hypothetical protein AGMMS50229_12100 [Campylobacterota bacterium]|nr:hypothetical protein AGMMS50229_12100 [Campylobacterota bacterium]